jgi:hypothetical protein
MTGNTAAIQTLHAQASASVHRRAGGTAGRCQQWAFCRAACSAAAGSAQLLLAAASSSTRAQAQGASPLSHAAIHKCAANKRMQACRLLRDTCSAGEAGWQQVRCGSRSSDSGRRGHSLRLSSTQSQHTGQWRQSVTGKWRSGSCGGRRTGPAAQRQRWHRQGWLHGTASSRSEHLLTRSSSQHSALES